MKVDPGLKIQYPIAGNPDDAALLLRILDHYYPQDTHSEDH